MAAENLCRNRVLDTLAKGGVSIGVMASFVRNPAMVRMISRAGYDFVNIDMEHSSLSWETVGDMAEMARAAGITPIVRPYNDNGLTADRILDLGAMGLMFFDIRSHKQVEDLHRYMKYPPRGDRGTTTHGSPTDYELGGSLEMREQVDAQTLMVIQIESREAVENIDSILEGGGVDIVEVGRNDISSSYGVPHAVRDPKVLAAIDRVIEAGEKHGCYPGTVAFDEEDARDMISRGIRHVSYSSDRSILNKAFRGGSTMLRSVSQEVLGDKVSSSS